MSIPRSASRSSQLRRLRVKRPYIITTSRMISNEELKKRNGLAGLQGLGIKPPCPEPLTFGAFALTDRARICSDSARVPDLAQFCGGKLANWLNTTE